MNTSVLSAVLKRNLVSYFSSPLGYVFIWLFMLLSAAAAFFPPDFFNANLANLDQLNKAFPFIMLFFVPAITMSIWADEVRQGTDELLLTMPATDFDIVIGKYLAAVSIYTIALLISMGSNYLVLRSLGKPDVGLYLCTHFGYWLLGLAMLAVGMVASFLTRNLTMAYVFGALFNLPLVFMSRMDVIPGLSHSAAEAVREWSFGGQCEEFGRGILSLSGIFYFLLIAAVMLYLCVILIGRRHWARSDDAIIQALHFAVRCVALAAITVAIVFFLENHDVRRDATSERLTALSPYTVTLVDDLKDDYKKAREIEPEISRLEETQKKAQLEAEKKAADEKKAAQEKQDSEKQAKEKTAAAKDTAAKSPGAKPDAKMAGETADAKSSAASAKSEDKKAAESKPALSPEDAQKLAKLKAEFDKLKIQGPVRIDAYVSPEVPELYTQTRINLLNVLREFKILGGDMVELNINEIDRFDPLAEVAKTRYNIVPREVMDTSNGAFKKESIFLGVAFTCGLEKIVLPFIDRGLPPEYELVRSLCTVTKQKRKRVGVLETDAHVTGNFTMSGMSPEWALIQELRKQYEVVTVNPAELMAPPKPGEPEKRYDVLLAVQPSALGPRELDSFIATIRMGQPTLILEDPFFLWMRGIPGTYQPRQPQQQNPMMGFNQQNQEKGDIRALWRLLGIDFSDGGDADNEFNPMGGGRPPSGTERVVWQRYSPFPKLGNAVEPEWVFVDQACGAKMPFNEEDPISSKLQHLFMLAPGFIEDTPDAMKRLVAKWNNKQYARQLTKEMNELHDKIENPSKDVNEEQYNEMVARYVDIQEENTKVSGGGDGKKTIQPAQLKDDTNLEDLISKIGPGHKRGIADLVNDLKSRCPLPPSDDDAEEGRTVLLTKEDAAKINEDADRLQREAERLQHDATSSSSSTPGGASAASRFKHAADLKTVAAKLKRATARLTEDGAPLVEKQRDLNQRVADLEADAAKLAEDNSKPGRSQVSDIRKKIEELRAQIAIVSDDVQLLKLRIIWNDQAASLKDQAAELLSKTGQKPEVVMLDEETANSKIALSRFKEMLGSMKTVGDVIKYAQEAVALQLKDRKFVPLVETSPDAGTIPTGKIMGGDDFEMQGNGLSPFRSLYYQSSGNRPFVLAAHITAEPRDRMGGAPINVVLVADVEAVNDMFFKMREQGSIPGQDIVFDFDNVTFVLNALDSLAGDDRFLELRKRRPEHRTLALFDERTRDARRESAKETEAERAKYDEDIRAVVTGIEAAKEKDHRIAKVKGLGRTEEAQLVERDVNALARKLGETRSDSNLKYNDKMDQINNELEAKIRDMQGTYKLWAVLLPPIPLLLVAAGVFFYRREKEREGVSSKRLR